jgi:hypothetical protein
MDINDSVSQVMTGTAVSESRYGDEVCKLYADAQAHQETTWSRRASPQEVFGRPHSRSTFRLTLLRQ